MRQHSLGFLLAAITASAAGCSGADQPNHPDGPAIEVKGTPDLDPKTDHDIDVKSGAEVDDRANDGKTLPSDGS